MVKKKRTINAAMPSNMSDAISIFEEIGQINHRNNRYDSRIDELVDVVNSHSDDIEDLEANKQNTLVAGANITINGNVISATSGSEVAMSDNTTGGVNLTVSGTTKTLAKQSDLASKQNTLIAGENITIENNIISAVGGGLTPEYITPIIKLIHQRITNIDINCYKIGDYMHIDGEITKATGTGETINISETLFTIFFGDQYDTSQRYLLPKLKYANGQSFCEDTFNNSSFINIEKANGRVWTNKAMGAYDKKLYFNFNYIIQGSEAVTNEQEN